MRSGRGYPFKLSLYMMIFIFLGTYLSCQNPFSPIEDLDLIPEVIIAGGTKITMDCFLYRDMMPGVAPDGTGLIAIITLTADGVSVFPDYITADRLYVIYGKDTWETTFEDEIRPRDATHLNQIELVARNGPKWPLESKVNVVVRVRVEGGGHRYIKALNKIIGAVY